MDNSTVKNDSNMTPEQEKLPDLLRHFFLICLCVFLILALTGTKACQEDYEFGVRSQVAATATTTPDDGLITSTPTSEGEEATPTAPVPAEATATAIATAIITAGITGTANIAAARGDASELLQQLGRLSEAPAPEKTAAPKSIPQPGGNGIVQKVENWLGNLYSREKGGEDDGGDQVSNRTDRDNDGYTDLAEDKLGSEALDPNSIPRIALVTNLEKRMAAFDEDEDGLDDDEEDRIGTFPDVIDSDGDGTNDGAEVLSGSDPLDSGSRPVKDTDRDGLSDSFEQNSGLNPLAADSDRDGVRDDLEMALGTDPFHIDTDKDGITDGMELKLGSDPMKPEGTPIVK